MGVELCSPDVVQPFAAARNRSQPFATVRNRPREGLMAVPMVSSAKGVPFGAFQRRLASFRVAGVALRDIFQHVSRRVKRGFCVADATLLRRFQKMHCLYRGRRSTLETSDGYLIFGRLSTLDVSCCVFSANRNVSTARSGDKVQSPWQAWHFMTCHENRRKPRTKR